MTYKELGGEAMLAIMTTTTKTSNYDVIVVVIT
jgi:hypothetical protein